MSGGGIRAVAGDRPMRADPAPHNDPVAQSLPEADAPLPDPQSYEEVVALVAQNREAILFAHLERNVRPVRFEPGRLEINPSEHAPRNLSGNLAALLTKWTGRRWICAISSEAGEPSLAERRAAAKERSLAAAEAHPLVKAVRAQFPGAEIAAVRDRNEDLPLPVDTQSQGDDDA